MAEEQPRKVYWAGRQWCVTDYGLETIDPDEYYVEAALLAELTQGADQPTIERLRHIAEKTWVDIEDLIASFAIAIQIHKVDVPAGALLATIEHARSERYANEAFDKLRPKNTTGIVMGQEMMGLMEASDAAVEERRAQGWSFELIPDPAIAETLPHREER